MGPIFKSWTEGIFQNGVISEKKLNTTKFPCEFKCLLQQTTIKIISKISFYIFHGLIQIQNFSGIFEKSSSESYIYLRLT